jgi:hypothetical protein
MSNGDRRVEVIPLIRIELDEDELVRSLAVGRMKSRQAEVSSLVERSRDFLEPKAVYQYARVEAVEGDAVTLEGGHTLTSRILGDKLVCGQQVAPYVVTVGPKLEDEASRLGKINVFQSFVLERIADHAVGKAASEVRCRVGKQLEGPLSSFSPGTGTGELFRIEQQEVLFNMLDPATRIGVRLTPSFLMLPRKSVSGVFASTGKEYVACEHCPRERCQNRRIPYVGKY